MQTLDRRTKGDRTVVALRPSPEQEPPPVRAPALPLIDDLGEDIRLPLGLLAMVGAAGVVVVQAPPTPFGAWLLLASLYFVVETALARPGRPFGEAGWPALVAMVSVLGPSSVVLGATVPALVAGTVHRLRFGEPYSASGRFLAAVPAVTAGAAVLVLVPVEGAWTLLVGGVAAGAGVRLQRWVLPRTTGRDRPMSPPDRPPWHDTLEMAALGATAAMLGGLLAASGWVAVPIAVAALLVVAAVDHLRGDEARRRRAAVDSLLMAVEAKDLYTRGHCERVAILAVALGEACGLPESALHRLETAGRLHDVGKLAVDRQLLRKRGRLDADEYHRVQEHSAAVGEILGGIGFLAPVVPMVVEHHRHYDGTPYGMAAGDGEPTAPCLEARILAVADAYDAMTTHRPYRRALSRRYAVAELRRGAGTQFDPEVVEKLVELLDGSGVLALPGGYGSDEEARRAAEAVALHG